MPSLHLGVHPCPPPTVSWGEAVGRGARVRNPEWVIAFFINQDVFISDPR